MAAEFKNAINFADSTFNDETGISTEFDFMTKNMAIGWDENLKKVSEKDSGEIQTMASSIYANRTKEDQ
jgi:hypothetical protein